VDADIIAISTLMTTTMEGMTGVLKILEKEGIRGKFKVIVGGGPVSQAFADKIGADGYAANAAGSVRLVRRLTEKSRVQNLAQFNPTEKGHPKSKGWWEDRCGRLDITVLAATV